MVQITRQRTAMLAKAVGFLAIALAPHVLVSGLTAETTPDARPRGISLVPAVVMLAGEHGQSHRQQLQLTNHTAGELTFEMVAEDIVTEDGARVFVKAGDRADSIAATAVFSPRTVTIPPGGTGVSDVVLTVPPGTAVRAVAAIFRGQAVPGPHPGVSITASLGSLITFSLSGGARLEAEDPEVQPQTDSQNLAVGKWVTNVGSEPVVAGGTVALLDTAGALVARLVIEPQRLLPGERLFFSAPAAELLDAGRYRALVSLEHDRTVVNRTVDFVVGPHDPRLAAAGPAGDRR
jgi:hypothetical protein